MTEELTPESRKEAFLAKAAGESVETPTPESREEYFLNKIAEGGGGGGTSDFDSLTNRPKYDNATMTKDTNIPKVIDTAFTGTDGTSAGATGLVPAPATTDAGKFLKADGTWDTAGGATVVQTTGTSTTDVMSQNAVTSALFADPATEQLVQIGHNANAGNYSGSIIGRIAIGKGATATGDQSNIAIGNGVQATTTGTTGRAIGIGGNATKNDTINIGGVQYNGDGKDNVIIGFGANVNGGNHDYCVAIGRNATCSRRAEVNIGTGTSTTKGYNNTAYRILGGVHDPEDAHDAATKGYVDVSKGLARQLTSGDYNWNSTQNAAVEPYDCVAVWILDPGTYYAGADVVIRRDPSNSSSGEPVTFLVVPRQTDQGSYGEFYSVSVYFFTPNNGISIWRSYYNLFVQDEWSAGASETYVTSDTMNNALNSHIEVTWTVPDDTTYGESGKLLVYLDTSGAIPSASVYVCAGFYVDPSTQEDKYAWTQI